MKTLLGVLSGLLLSVVACAGVDSPGNLGGFVVPLNYRGIRGHGCPFTPTEAYTARHVSTAYMPGGRERALYMIWGDINGHYGTVQEVHADSRRDLSIVEVKGGDQFSVIFPIAREAPPLGDSVFIINYDFERADLRPLVFGTKITALMEGEVITESTPGPGSSGSCVLHLNNGVWEVVAIHTAGVSRGEHHETGLSTAVYGSFAEIPAEWDEDADHQ